MAMDGDTMGSAVASALDALSEANKKNTTACWQAICGAIISHITANAEVYVTSVSGVEPGAGTSGSGSGTVS